MQLAQVGLVGTYVCGLQARFGSDDCESVNKTYIPRALRIRKYILAHTFYASNQVKQMKFDVEIL